MITLYALAGDSVSRFVRQKLFQSLMARLKLPVIDRSTAGTVRRFAPKALLPSRPSTKPCPNSSHFWVIVIGLLTANLTLVNLCDSWPPDVRAEVSCPGLLMLCPRRSCEDRMYSAFRNQLPTVDFYDTTDSGSSYGLGGLTSLYAFIFPN